MMTVLPNEHYSIQHKATEEGIPKECLQKRSGKRNVDSRFQVQLEKDGSGSTNQSWMEKSDL